MIQWEPTPKWPGDFESAVEIYNRTVFLSGIDMNGYPQLTQLEFVMNSVEREIDSRELFMEYIEMLHSESIKMRNAR